MDDKTWPGVTIGSWELFVQNVWPYLQQEGFVYRGVADRAYELRPSLLRYALSGWDHTHLLELEDRACKEFMAQAHLYVSSEQLPDRLQARINWWAIMQHFGAPTRLLDWTRSPFVAAYFAVEKHPGQTGVVYVVDADAVEARASDVFQEKTPAERATSGQDAFFFWESPRRTARLNAQQGLFSMNGDVTQCHDRISDVCRRHSRRRAGLEPARAFLFPPETKDQILRGLRATNIAAHSLFPGLDGLGRSICEIGRLWRSGKPQTIKVPTIVSGSHVYAPSIDTHQALQERSQHAETLRAPRTEKE